MLVDYGMLGKKLSAAGLTGKPVNEYTKEEIAILVSACVDALMPNREGPFMTKPSIENKRLIVPATCHPKYWWWGPGQSIAATLTELKATDEVWAKYVADGGEDENNQSH